MINCVISAKGVVLPKSGRTAVGRRAHSRCYAVAQQLMCKRTPAAGRLSKWYSAGTLFTSWMV